MVENVLYSFEHKQVGRLTLDGLEGKRHQTRSPALLYLRLYHEVIERIGYRTRVVG